MEELCIEKSKVRYIYYFMISHLIVLFKTFAFLLSLFFLALLGAVL